jgi:hypothetical protein
MMKTMIPPDQALLDVWNRTATAYVQNAPAYITYNETTHASSSSVGRTEDINRYVAVRQADDFAVMRDLPDGGERTGKAFPIIPYFDPISQWDYSWFANLKKVDINLTRYPVGSISFPPPDSAASMSVGYFSFWAPSNFPDSAPGAEHLRVMATPNDPARMYYFPEIVVDPQTHLPSRIEIKWTTLGDDLKLDYRVIDGHWIVTHATYVTQQHYGFMNFTVTSETAYNDIAFPADAPDPRLAGTPAPAKTPGSH